MLLGIFWSKDSIVLLTATWSFCCSIEFVRLKNRVTKQKLKTKFVTKFSCEFTPKHTCKPASVLPLIKLLCSTKSKFSTIFFIIKVSFQGLTVDSYNSKGRKETIFTPLRIFRQIFAYLHLKWLSHILNLIASNYQTATQWALPPFWIRIWLIVYHTSVRFELAWPWFYKQTEEPSDSHLQIFSPRYFVESLFEAFHSFKIKNLDSVTFHASNSFSCKHDGAIFYKHRNPFNFVRMSELRKKLLRSIWNKIEPWDNLIF